MRVWFVPALLLLSACTGGQQRGDPSGEDPLVADFTPGLHQVEPDLCHAADFARYQGQPATALEGVPIARKYRVIPDGGITTQEYTAGRVNFWLGKRGEIARIGCG